MRQAAAFGAALRRERERRGVSLEQIAEDTKVGLALLEALERGDLTRWPTGIFRRAFVRAYAESAGLDARAVLSEFLQIFPDEDTQTGALPLPAEPLVLPTLPEATLRITFADEAGGDRRVAARRLAAVVTDLAIVAVVAWLVSLTGAPWPWPALVGVIGLAYFALGVAALGTSPVWWWSQRAVTAARRSPATAGETPVVFDGPASVGARGEQGPRDEER